jgi:hypothetical protein
MTASVNQQSLTLLHRLESKEARLQARLQHVDSSKAQQLFSGSTQTYRTLESKIQAGSAAPGVTLRHYIPGIDSMSAAIAFIGKTGLASTQLQKLQSLSQQLKQLQGSLQNADDVEDYLSQREAGLSSQLSQYGFGKRILAMQEDAYYYQQQVSQYKNVLNDGQKQQQLILTVVRELPAFQDFWQKNSMLAQLFPAPGNAGTLLASTGLQSSAQVNGLIQQRLGTDPGDGGANAGQYLQQQAGSAQGQMDQLKDKLNNLGLNGGSSNMVMPDFSPNTQKQKTFLKRLEYGLNMQTSGSTQWLPSICTLGFSLGYKISDKATMGVGLDYQLGLGDGISHIRLSNQGIGLRSFIDVKAAKSIWVTGGYEYNYMQQFAGINSIKNLDLWAKSALIGLTKKYNVGKRSGNIQLLYDLLSEQEVPRGQPLKLRFGYSF